MAKLTGELQSDNGDVLYPHTSTEAVFAKDGKTVGQQITVLERDKLSNKSIVLTRIESTSDQAIYTCPVNLELDRIYLFGTGSSPVGTVKNIILRCNLGDYTFKISNTNTVDTMKDAGWGDFNAGVRVYVSLREVNNIKGAVIVSPSYSTSYFATTDKIDILWVGSQSTGTITLNSPINGKYDTLIMATGNGDSYLKYTIDYESIVPSLGTINFLTSTGTALLTVAENGLSVTITSTTQPIRRILGMRSGGR